MFPNVYEIYHHIALTLYKQNKYYESIECLNVVLNAEPNYKDAKYNISFPMLATGQYIQGWNNYENRNREKTIRPSLTKPEWNGENINGKTLFVYSEQGLGDVIQYCRYLPLIKEYNCKVIVQCSHELTELIKTINVDEVVNDIPNEYDYHISIVSLPYIFKTTLHTIPRKFPYFNIPKEPMLEEYSGLKIGLVWAGNPRKFIPFVNLVDQRRSMKLEYFKPLAEFGTLFSLQKGEEAVEQLNEVDFEVIDLMKNTTSFYDTAKIIQNLDLIIAVDTSIVHIVGAMNKKVWMLSRFDGCWRWMNKHTSPWYPTMKIFKQPTHGDWKTVIDNVVKELKK